MSKQAERGVRVQRLNQSPSDRMRSSSRSSSSGNSQGSCSSTGSTTPPRSKEQEAERNRWKDTPPKLRRVLPGSSQQGSGNPDVAHQMSTACPRTSPDEAPKSTSPARSRTRSPLPGSSSLKVEDSEMRRGSGSIDTASKKKKKNKPNKDKTRSEAPGFDLTKNPGGEKNVVVGFMQRLKKNAHGNNSPHQLGICFNTVEVKRGDDHCHQSTLTITAEDRDGAPYAWSGKEFRGEVVGKKAKAENAAARAFLADAAVQETAANMDPPNERQSTPNQKQRFLVLKEFKRAKKAAKADRKSVV